VCTLHQWLWVSQFGPQNWQLRFGDLDLKITVTISWLGLKTKRAMGYRLCHKTNGKMKTVLDTRRDLAACFVWKQVVLGFPSLVSRLVEVRRGWCTWHHCGGRVEMKLKIDGLMRRVTSDSSTPTLPFSLY
jgi:hypothetical protein